MHQRDNLERFGFIANDADGIDDILAAFQDLPSGFGKDPYFGLGIKYEFRYLIDAIEDLDDITDLHVQNRPTPAQGLDHLRLHRRDCLGTSR